MSFLLQVGAVKLKLLVKVKSKKIQTDKNKDQSQSIVWSLLEVDVDFMCVALPCKHCVQIKL